MPNAILQVAAQMLGLRFGGDGQPGAEGLKNAVGKSGLFQEKALAALATAGTKGAAMAAGTVPSTSGDLKSSLLSLKTLLQVFLGADAGDEASLQALLAGKAGGHRPSAPRRGALPEGQRPASPTLDPSAGGAEKALAAGRQLLGQTEAALSRLRLTQFASLSDGKDASVHRSGPATPQIMVDIPIALGRETAVAQFTVERDGGSGAEADTQAAWRVRFAVDMEPLGPVRALIAMRGENVDVQLWAERPETVSLFADHASDLRDGLKRAEFQIDDVRFWTGKPPEARRSGALVDRKS